LSNFLVVEVDEGCSERELSWREAREQGSVSGVMGAVSVSCVCVCVCPVCLCVCLFVRACVRA
jgi:hypothetical protein